MNSFVCLGDGLTLILFYFWSLCTVCFLKILRIITFQIMDLPLSSGEKWGDIKPRFSHLTDLPVKVPPCLMRYYDFVVGLSCVCSVGTHIL
jgi:hypothetical protein